MQTGVAVIQYVSDLMSIQNSQLLQFSESSHASCVIQYYSRTALDEPAGSMQGSFQYLEYDENRNLLDKINDAQIRSFKLQSP